MTSYAEIDLVNTQEKRLVQNRIRATGILAGLMLNANFLCGALSNYINIRNIYVYSLVLLGVLAIFVNRMKLPIKRIHAIVYMAILFQVIYGKIFVGTSTSEHFFLCFIGVALPCMIISFYEIDVDYMLVTIVFSSILCIPYFLDLFKTTYSVYNSGFQMGVAYSILPGIVAGIIVLFNRKFKSITRGIGLLAVLLGSVEMINLQTRGAYLCLFVFIIGFLHIKNQNNSSKRFLAILGIVLALGILIYFFGNRLLSSNWYFRVFGLKQSNILNGRELDYSYVFSWRGTFEFVFGSGVGSFKKYGYTEYIHNIFGQIYYEQGIYSTIFVLVVVFSAIKVLLNRYTVSIDKKAILLMFFCIGIVRLMLSYYFWIDQYFWMFLWMMLDKNYQRYLITEE